MKSILTAVMILGLFINIYAQQSPERIQLQLQTEKAARMKSGGVALVVVGGILAICGVVTMVDNFSLFWRYE